jgi:hypothetical protein
LTIDRDSSISDERVLLVEYPAPTDDPAGPDIQCVAETKTGPVGARFHQIRPTHSMRLSLSFVDRNRVAYTASAELKGGVWQLGTLGGRQVCCVQVKTRLRELTTE